MRRVIRAVAAVAVAAGTLAVIPLTAQSAGAAPSMREREWWFGAWQVERIWQTTKGAGVTVAVLDTGVNASLPELSGAILPGGDVTGSGTDGRTDVDQTARGHGTSMSALIAARGQGSGLLGVAPEAKILPVLTHADKAGELGVNVYPAGIRFATDHGAKVISISQASDGVGFPNDCPNEVQDAVKYAVQHDVVVVAAAGNEGDGINSGNYPASCKGVLAVGAIDSNRQPWVSTQRQSYVDVGAPGVQIATVDKNGQLVVGDGTSPATALVSGAVALVRSRYPDMPARQVVARILATVSDAGPAGKDDQTGFGAVRAFQAVTDNVPDNAPNPVFDELGTLTPPSGQPSAGPSGGSTGTPGGPGDTPSSAAANAAAGDGDSGSSSTGVVLAVVVGALVVVLFVVSTMTRRRGRARRLGTAGPGHQWPQQPGDRR